MTSNYFLIFLIIFLFGCNNINHDWKQSFNHSDADNQKEFQKVIKYYSLNAKDSLKLKSAKFLISNLHHHYELRSTDTVPDSNLMSSSMLIENIEYAFKAWEMPWARHIDFESFCEYILPYRFGTEKLESWRPIFMEEFKWLIDSMGQSQDHLLACEFISKNVNKWFKYTDERDDVVNKSPISLLFEKKGNCTDESAIICFAMRSMGIPVTHDFIPSWGFMDYGHDFNSVLKKKNEFIPFTGKVFRKNDPYKIERAAKVYRSKFSRIEYGSANENYLGLDVSKCYLNVQDIEINLDEENNGIFNSAFICVYNFNKWTPISEGFIDRNKIIFNDLGVNILYLVIGEVNGELKPIQEPFILESNGKRKILRPRWSDKENYSSIRRKSSVLKKSLNRSIEQNYQYELYYYNNYNWESLGRKNGTVNYDIEFNNLPFDALFLIKNLTKNTISRPFTFSDKTITYW